MKTDLRARDSSQADPATIERSDPLSSGEMPRDTLVDPILRKASGPPALGAEAAFGAASAGGGGPVPHRAAMEQRFGADFGSVRAHTGRGAEAKAMGAVAATRGEDVVFAESAPSEPTVAHELAHVVQFRQGQVASAASPFGDPGSGPEREADRAEATAGTGGSFTVGERAGAAIHRKEAPGSGRVIPPIVSASGFKSATYVRFATRGENLTIIDTWLQAVDAAGDDQAKFDRAVEQAAGAAKFWLGKHKGDDTGSVVKRFPHVKALWDALQTLRGEPQESAPGPIEVAAIEPKGKTAGDLADPTEKLLEKPKDDNADIAAGFVGGTSSLIGGIGAIRDYRNAEGKDKKTYDAVEGGKDVAEGTLKLGSNIAKVISETTGSEGAGAFADATGIGADGLGAVGGVMDIGKGLHGAAQDPALTRSQKVDLAASTTKTAATVVKDTVGIAKEVGSVSASAAKTVGGSVGVVTGGVDVLHGIYKMVSAASSEADIDEARAALRAHIVAEEKKLAGHDVEARLAANEAFSHGKDLADSKDRAARSRTQSADDKKALEARIAALVAKEKELNDAAKAMSKVQDRRMKAGAFKAATGTLDVVAGALTISGVGAPIALAIGIVSGLLKLGAVGLDVGRGWKAGKLTHIALRIDDTGNPKGMPDPDPKVVGYRGMERRVRAAYYNHYLDAFDKKTPPAGMIPDHWEHVRDFVLEDKLSRVDEERTNRFPKSAANSQDRSLKENRWGVATEGGKDVKEEYPDFISRRGLDLTFSAAKSADAVSASNHDLATALVKIGTGAFDRKAKTFVPTPVVPVGADAEGKKLDQQMASTLLGAVGITDAVWLALWKDAKGGVTGEEKDLQTLEPSKFLASVKSKVDKT